MQNLNVLEPNCDEFNDRYCLKDRWPLHKVSNSLTEMSCWGSYEDWNYELGVQL